MLAVAAVFQEAAAARASERRGPEALLVLLENEESEDRLGTKDRKGSKVTKAPRATPVRLE